MIAGLDRAKTYVCGEQLFIAVAGRLLHGLRSKKDQRGLIRKDQSFGYETM
jgi:hypothetical protein